MKTDWAFVCKCFTHITQGPCTCWVCGEELGFCYWQTGKPEQDRLAKPLAKGLELNLDPNPRWWGPDDRDLLKDKITTVRRGPGYLVREYREHVPGYLQGFAGDDRWDWETRTRFDVRPDPPAEQLGLVIINHLFNL